MWLWESQHKNGGKVGMDVEKDKTEVEIIKSKEQKGETKKEKPALHSLPLLYWALSFLLLCNNSHRTTNQRIWRLGSITGVSSAWHWRTYYLIGYLCCLLTKWNNFSFCGLYSIIRLKFCKQSRVYFFSTINKWCLMSKWRHQACKQR